MTQMITAVGGAPRAPKDKDTQRGARSPTGPKAGAPSNAPKRPRSDKELLAELEQIIGYKMDERR